MTEEKVVGDTGLEPVTSCMSSVLTGAVIRSCSVSSIRAGRDQLLEIEASGPYRAGALVVHLHDGALPGRWTPLHVVGAQGVLRMLPMVAGSAMPPTT